MNSDLKDEFARVVTRARKTANDIRVRERVLAIRARRLAREEEERRKYEDVIPHIEKLMGMIKDAASRGDVKCRLKLHEADFIQDHWGGFMCSYDSTPHFLQAALEGMGVRVSVYRDVEEYTGSYGERERWYEYGLEVDFG